MRKADPDRYVNKEWAILQPTIQGQQTGGIGITGNLLQGGSLQQQTDNGLRIGFNNGKNNTAGSNIQITNQGVDGVGYPQVFDNITGSRNIKIFANTLKTGGSAEISGDDNVLINGHRNTAISGNRNIVINVSYASANTTSGSDNIYVGQHAGKSITTGRGNIHIWNFDINGSSAFSSSLQDTIIIGDFSGASDSAARGICNINPTRYVESKFIWGGETGLAKLSFHCRKRTGTNVSGWDWDFFASKGTGTGRSGHYIFNTYNSIASGTTQHSTSVEQFRIGNDYVKVAKVFKAGQYTGTAAEALTAEDGDLIYITATSTVFTSIGFWGRENGAWVKL
jgi:hypothetical protein